ncbi:ABC transporter permease [Melittangium boletus]|uniref:ABC transporter permease n=1 Tax=Melittangium boletus TaxID=83453 RepID=UPI003DA49794
MKRLVSTLGAALGALVLVSLFLHLVPGDPIDVMLGEQAMQVDREALRRAVGLDAPVPVQLWRFTRDLFTGELRTSLPPFQKKVLPAIGAALPYTGVLALAALAVAVSLALPLGLMAAARRGTWADALAMAGAAVGVALPRFWVGPLLVLLLALRLDWLPVSGAGSWRHLVLPALTLGGALAAFLARMTRAALLEVLREDYITVARAQGLGAARVLWRHALRTALLPLLTVLGLEFGALLGGAIVTEKVFAWPGMGTLLLQAIERRDYNTVRATVLVFTGCYLLVHALTDAAYALADPRVRRRA